MSLFERIKYKRYDLQEKKKTTSSSASSGNNKSNENISTGRSRIRKAISDLDATQPQPIETGKTTYSKNKNVSQDIGQRRTAQSNQQQLFNRQYDAYDDGDLGNPSQSKSQTSSKVTTGKGVDQAEVSKQAKDFTKKINKQRVVKQKNIFGGEDFVKDKSLDKFGRNRNRVKRKYNIPGQQSLDLGGDVTKKTPTPRLSKSGEIVTDLRTVPKKPRTARKRSPLAKAPKPEKMVIAPDPIKGGFKKVGATTTTGRKIIKQSVSTDELLKNQSGNKKQNKKQYKKEYKKAFNNKAKTGKTLFQRIKDIGRKSKEYLGKAHQFMIKDAGFRKTSKFAGYGRNVTRNTFKNTMRGNTMRAINKVLPGKYKALAAIAAGTYLATRGKKNAGAGSGDGKPKVYDAYQKTLGFDTGKKKEP